jgi:WD40-like Beta Propeller Repeat
MDEPLGAATLEVVAVPSNALCLSLNIKGRFTSTKKLTLTPGQTASFSLTQLPLGAVQFSGNIYGVTCSSVTSSTTPTWSSDTVTANLSTGSTPKVTLVFFPDNGKATIAIDFDAGAGSAPCDLGRPFGSVQVLAFSGFSGSRSDGRLSPDELSIYLGSDSDLRFASRAARSDAFGAPFLLSGVNSTSLDGHPSATADGLTMYFDSNRSGSSSVYVASRSSVQSTFGAPAEVSVLSSMGAAGQPYVLPNGSVLYFSAEVTPGDGQLFFAPHTSSGFGAPIAISTVNSSFDEQAPAVTPDQLTMFFASRRPDSGAQGGWDIWMSRRSSTGSQFGAATNVQELNSFEDEKPNWISADGCRLYFNRGEGMYFAERPR